MQKPLLSIGIIFKNEIRCIERCLKALQPLRDAIPCEVVMADTGATDGSRDIAQKYADILVDFPWINDFSAARNAVMDRCSGKWYFTIDCDEWLDPNVEGIVRFVTNDCHYDFGSIIIRNYFSQEAAECDSYADFLATRLLRMSTGIRYEGAIHEHWPYRTGANSGIVETMMISGALLHHDGYAFEYPEQRAKKEQRNMDLLLKKLENDPGDLLTLMQCIESGSGDSRYIDWLHGAVKGVEEKRPLWELVGPPILRYAVKSAVALDLSERDEWIAMAEDMFPDSVFTKVDVAYYAFGVDWEKKDYGSCVCRGENFLQAVSDFRAGNFNRADILASSLSQASPHCELCVATILASAYLYEKKPEQCAERLKALNGSHMDVKQVGDSVRVYAHLYTHFDHIATDALLLQFWEQINKPEPTSQRANQRRDEFVRMGSEMFSESYMNNEEEKETFSRHAYTLFLPLAGKCVLGDAAKILCTEDTDELEKKLSEIKDFAQLPITALTHALEAGVPFPLRERPLNVEEMDALAERLVYANKDICQQLVTLDVESAAQELQTLCWVRGLMLAAVQTFPWSETDADRKTGFELMYTFAQVEKLFLPLCYAPRIFEDSDAFFLLPPMHRFGWYCSKAFWALDAGDPAEYVRLLRRGLETCPGTKPMVEFLLRQLEESRKIQSTPELLTLAEQVRALLAQYPADDPAVEALKQSAAYQKVAHLIEGPELGMYGGIKQ